MKVSIVIPVYNAAATLRECLAACLAQSHSDCEVVVVDDGSTDASPEIAREYPIKLVQQRQRGPAAARNAGAQASDGEVIAFTDSDCVPHRDWIERLIASMSHDVCAAGGTYGIANPDSALARLIHAEIVARHARYGSRIDFAGSYNMAVRKDVFQECGGFDEDFTTSSAEDNDFCYRIADAGHTIAFARDAVVDHYHPARLGKYLRTQARHGFWRMKLYAKHPRRTTGDRYASGLDLWSPPIAVLLFAGTAISFVTTGAPVTAGLLFALVLLCFSRIVSAARITQADRSVPVSYAAAVLVLRDCARGIGLAAGVLRFLVLRKTTA